MKQAQRMQQQMGFKSPLRANFLPYESLPGKYQDVRHRIPDTTKARELLGNDAYGLMPAESNENLGAARPSSGDATRASAAYTPTPSSDDINSLIASDGWSERKPRIGTGQAAARVEAPEPEPAKVEMLSPDLVFTDNDKEKDDER